MQRAVRLRACKDLVMASETKESYKVTEIAANAFKGNKNLRTVTLGKNIVTLGKNAFSKCKALKKLIIGKNVTTIGNKTFYGCSKLSRITIKSTKLKKVGNKAIAKIKKNAYIKVPSKKVKAYKKLLKAKTGYKKSMKISK